MEMKAERRNPCPVHRKKTKSLIRDFASRFHFFMCFLLLLLHIVLPGKVYAAEITVFPKLDGNVSALTDSTFGLTISEVLRAEHQKDFYPSPTASFNYGFAKTAVWIKVSIPSDMNGNGVLSFMPNFLDTVDIYVGAPGKAAKVSDFIKYEAGDHRPVLSSGISGIDDAVALTFSAGKTTTVYIHVVNHNSVTQLSLRLEEENNHGRQLVTGGLLYGVWFGGMGTLFLTQLVFFFFSRKAEYPLLALSTLGVIMIYFGNLGLSHVYLFRGFGAGNDAFIGVNAWSGLAASALAYMHILNLRRYAPKMRWFYLFTAFSGLVGVGFALTGKTAQFGPYGSMLSIVGVFVTVFLSLRQINTEGSASRLRAAAFFIMGVGATLTMLQRLGLSWLPHWTFHAYGAAILFQTLLLTGSLVVRLRDLEIRNWKMHKDALRQSRTAERIAAHLVEERTKELVDARRAAEDALRAEIQSQLSQVRFLEVVSHQYRTPLAAIRSSVDSIELALPEGDDDNRSRISRIRRSISRLVELLEANLVRSRLQGPSYKPKMKIREAASIVERAYLRAKDLHGAEIVFNVDDDAQAVKINADSGMLDLAIINLLDNAVKYSASRGAITLSLSLREPHVMIEVSDTGPGIPSEELPYIFDKLMRGSNAETIEGSGLGLFLVAKITEIHGGAVEAESSPGYGTRISLLLPISKLISNS
ncbi:sensor histidine kinase [Brucella sp. BE17]|uniref:sensor histidine kinase n=1 Tax=Brucella sp. BE17 TaxID=3142977 RepID=UPI0031BA828C